MFDTMSYENFRAVVAPKVQGSWNLHELLPNDLDFFVLLSSAGGVLGNRSQANYCCGNTYQDGLAHYRVSRGQKAVSLDIGIVLSVGYLSERQELTKSLRSQGYTALTKLEFLAILDYHCNPSLPLLSHLACQVVTGINTPAALRKSGIPEPYWMDRPLFRNLHQVGSTVTASTDTSGNLVNYQQLLLSAGSLADASDIACVALVEKLSKTLAVRNKDIDINQPLHVYGVDSLVAVEVRSWLNKALGADVAIFEILGTGTIAALGLTTAGKSNFVQDVLRKEAQ